LYRTYNKRKTVCTNHQWTAVDFWYCGTIKYRDIWVIIINSFVALHYTVLFFILCPLSRYVFTWLRRSNGQSPMQSAVSLYINNLSSKKTTQNRYSINVTFLDYEYNWIKGLINTLCFKKTGTLFISFIIHSNDDQFTQNFYQM